MPLRPSGSRWPWPAAFALLAATLALGGLAARRELAPDGLGIDDAYIFLRYGRNLAAGLGWVWNPGGEPVEGFSSLAWTLAVAAIRRLTARVETPLFLLSLAAVGGALFAALRASLPGRGRTALAAAVAIAAWLVAEPSFLVWIGPSLMDTGLWCAALLATAASLVRLARAPSPASAAVAAGAQALLAATRPEALLVGPLTIALAALAARRPARVWAAPAATAALAQLALLGWRLWTFGAPLPNTYYAKLDADLAARLADGARYLGVALAEDPTRALVAALALMVGLASVVAPRALDRWAPGDGNEATPEPIARPATRATLALAAGLTLAGPLVALLEGGDAFPGQRTLVAFRPFEAALLFAVAFALARGRGRRRPAAVAAAAVALVALAGHAAGGARWGALEATTLHGRDWIGTRAGFDLGARLERLFGGAAEKPTVGLLAAGAAAYTYSGPSRDLLALNDPLMARATRRRRGFHGHSAFSAAGFFARPPELLPVATPLCTGDPAERTGRQFVFRALLRRLDRDPRFAAAYRLVQLEAPDGGGPALCTYARADWLERPVPPVRWRPVDDRPRARRSATAATD